MRIDVGGTTGRVFLGLLVLVVILVAFNIYATMELADEAADLKEALLSG